MRIVQLKLQQTLQAGKLFDIFQIFLNRKLHVLLGILILPFVLRSLGVFKPTWNRTTWFLRILPEKYWQMRSEVLSNLRLFNVQFAIYKYRKFVE